MREEIERTNRILGLWHRGLDSGVGKVTGEQGGAAAATVGSCRLEKVIEGKEPANRGMWSVIGEEEAVGPAQPSCKLYFVTNSEPAQIQLGLQPKGFFLRNTPLTFSSCDSTSSPTPSRRPLPLLFLSRLAPSLAAKPCH